ncbi:cellulose binding domain-containing protein, partial [Virgisporangium ochraceum]|uniref:cellulose binding domain-containing protein n=1 Tax=Virgisporangium ochraceum TaxID=65505 RepID=UPI001940FECF
CAFQAGSFQPQLAYSLANGVAPPQDQPSTPASSSSSPPSSSSSSPNTPPGACAATYRIDSQWNTGFGATVTVRAGTSAINGWTVRWTFANGQTISQIWNGTDTPNGASHSVRNVSHNGSLGAGASTSFGFNGTWSGTNSVPTLTCTTP